MVVVTMLLIVGSTIGMLLMMIKKNTEEDLAGFNPLTLQLSSLFYCW